MILLLRAAAMTLLVASLAGAQTAAPPILAAAPTAPSVSLDHVFQRLYNFDFASAHAALDDYSRVCPDDPLGWSVRAAAYVLAELDRLHILQTDFFMDDEKLVDDREATMKPDPDLRRKIFAAVDEARRLAGARLAVRPDDRDALLALCMTANVVTDYTTLVERRRWKGVRLAKQSVEYANRLRALEPPVFDAYSTTGALEYIVGSLPFYARWFVHYEKVDGDRRKGIEELKLVARHGRFYAPFARVLLAVISLREKKLEDARLLLAGLVADFPENPLFRRELTLVTARLQRAPGARKAPPG
jgi:hypothetical protein